MPKESWLTAEGNLWNKFVGRAHVDTRHAFKLHGRKMKGNCHFNSSSCQLTHTGHIKCAYTKLYFNTSIVTLVEKNVFVDKCLF